MNKKNKPKEQPKVVKIVREKTIEKEKNKDTEQQQEKESREHNQEEKREHVRQKPREKIIERPEKEVKSQEKSASPERARDRHLTGSKGPVQEKEIVLIKRETDNRSQNKDNKDNNVRKEKVILNGDKNTVKETKETSASQKKNRVYKNVDREKEKEKEKDLRESVVSAKKEDEKEKSGTPTRVIEEDKNKTKLPTISPLKRGK